MSVNMKGVIDADHPAIGVLNEIAVRAVEQCVEGGDASPGAWIQNAILATLQMVREAPEWSMGLLAALEAEVGFASAEHRAILREGVQDLVDRFPLRDAADGETSP